MANNSNCFIYRGKNSLTLTKWKVKAGSRITKNTVVLTYTNGGEDGDLRLKSDVNGTVETLLAQEGQVVQPGEALLQLKSCTHEVIMKELCAQCGADLRHLSRQNLQEVVASRSFSMVHIVPELRCSLEQAQQLDEADETRLLKAKKLTLLVDLDQTLIHTTNENIQPNLKDVYHFQLYGSQSAWYHTRLRPGTRSFLENISKSYELHIFTFGARMYSHKIASILDPDGKLFSHRILSRDECFDPTSKTGNLKCLFPRGDAMVCIIDDREDVWNFAPNVVHVKPYIYFRNTGDINAPPNGRQPIIASPGPPDVIEIPQGEPSNNNSDEAAELQTVSEGDNKTMDNDKEIVEISNNDKEVEEISNNDKEVEEISNNDEVIPENSDQKNEANNESVDEPVKKEATESVKGAPPVEVIDLAEEEDDDDDDDYLLYLEDILMTIHKAYYNIYEELADQDTTTVPDLKNVIPYVRRKVLRGVSIVFSGVIPTNMTPEKSSLWILAKSLGAAVSTELVLENSKNRTTHIIASKMGTAKLNKARKRGDIHIVTPSWLICCATRWERADERLFPLKKNGSSSQGVAKKYKKYSKSKELTTAEQEVVEETNKVKRRKKCSKGNSSEEQGSSNVLDFSSQELEMMGKEVMEACEESENSSDSNTLNPNIVSVDTEDGQQDNTSEPRPGHSIMESDSSSFRSGSVSSDNEEMASALERELFDYIPNS